ncbi:hypothetical protein [Sporosarcina sp. ITBMC105]
MTDFELKTLLMKVKEPSLQLLSIREEFRKYNTPYVDVRKIPKLLKFIFGFFIFYIISMPVGLLLSLVFMTFEVLGLLLSIFVVPGLFYATYKLYLFIEDKIIDIQLKKKSDLHSVRIREILIQEEELIGFLQDSGMPMNYCYPFAINSFETYLLNKRADTLKECINLFEQDRQNQQYINQLNTIQQIQEATYHEANSAKTMAFISMFSRR